MNRSNQPLDKEPIDISPSSGISTEYMQMLLKALEHNHIQDQIDEALWIVSQDDINEKKLKVLLLDNKIPVAISPQTLHQILETKIKNTKKDDFLNSLSPLLLKEFWTWLERLHSLKSEVLYLLEEMKKGAFLPEEIDPLEQISDQLLTKTQDIMRRYYEKPFLYPHVKMDHSVFEKYAEPIIEEYEKLIHECEIKLING